MSIATSREGTATLEKALDVLDAIGRAPQGLSQTDLGASLALPRTTLYRLLATLCKRGLVRRDPLRRVYCLGLLCFEYARQAYTMPDLVAAASLELRTLRDLTGETTYLAVLDGLEALSLERVDGNHSQRSAAALGQRKPLHCTSQGKAMLAAMSPMERNTVIKELHLSAHTPHTITDRRRLATELKRITTRGYAIDDEEIALGVRCCGAAIVDAAGRVRGAISVAAPAFRMTHARVNLLGTEVAQAARRIGAQLAPLHAQATTSVVQAMDGPWAFHGAFPRWSQRDTCLVWADMLAPAVYCCNLAQQAGAHAHHCIAAPETPVLALLLDAAGSVVALQDGWFRVLSDGALHPLPGLAYRGLSAACTAPNGSLWGCLRDDNTHAWRIADLRPDGLRYATWQVRDRISAMAWDAAGATLYAIAPDAGEVLMLQPGRATPQRLITIPKGSGQLSGIALDREGGVWTALRDGWSVVRICADGILDRAIAVPVPAPTDLGFGGTDGCTLYITSARDGCGIDSLTNAPLSGRIFVAALDIAGLAVHTLHLP